MLADLTDWKGIRLAGDGSEGGEVIVAWLHFNLVAQR